jgi:hypothetical protein
MLALSARRIKWVEQARRRRGHGMNHPNRALRTLLTVVCALGALVAMWQFYLFVQFKNVTGSIDPQGGTSNLWLAVTAILVACAAGAYLVFSAVTHDKEDVIHITSQTN